MKVEQAQKVAEEALKELSDALAAGHSDVFKKYLAAAGCFHNYSFSNVLLILSQRPDAQRVAGYRTWQSLGRFVKQGERGIAIIAPMLMRQQETETEHVTPTSESPRRCLRFRCVHVFDVAQTDGEPLPELAKVSGEPGKFLEHLKEAVRSAAITLSYEELAPGVMGVSRGGSIGLRAGMPAAEEFSTLVHEYAHELMHRDGEQRSKRLRETEAEAAAFAVCHSIGLDTSTASSDYIALHQGDHVLLSESLRRICGTAGQIISAIQLSR